jgi:beta-glucosidase
MTSAPRQAAISFPDGFRWGAATSAYQIEGASREDGKGESIWDRFVQVPGAIRGGATGDVACDHYHRWSEDVSLLRDLGLNAYRFSIAWTRILPDGRGRPNERGLAFYERLVDALLAAGVEPWITLYHWDLPQALQDAGGWPDRRTVGAFVDLADLVTRRLGDRVRHWMTINEPWEIGVLGYGEGVHAPGRWNRRLALQAIHHLLVAHGLARGAIRSNRPDADVAIVLDMVTCYPDRPIEADADAAHRMDGYFNRWFLDPLFRRTYPADLWAAYGADAPALLTADMETIHDPGELVGLNYYYSAWVRQSWAAPLRARVVAPHVPDRTALRWAVHPEGLAAALLRLRDEYGLKRIVVAESGAAFRDRPDRAGRVADRARARYHARYLEAIAGAIGRGAPVIGHFAWSLLDNFEWQLGYGPRFGLIRVDYATQRRTPKLSAEWYGSVARANRLLPLP